MKKINKFLVLLLLFTSLNCFCNEKQKTEDNKRKQWENSNQTRRQSSFKADASDYHNGKDWVVGYERPAQDWSKPVPQEKDVKCPKCSGTGLVKTVVGNNNPVLEVKICKRCSGKGTIGRSKI